MSIILLKIGVTLFILFLLNIGLYRASANKNDHTLQNKFAMAGVVIAVLTAAVILFAVIMSVWNS